MAKLGRPGMGWAHTWTTQYIAANYVYTHSMFKVQDSRRKGRDHIGLLSLFQYGHSKLKSE